MAIAVRDLESNPSRSMAIIQSAIVAYFESHTITKFRTNDQRMETPHQENKKGLRLLFCVPHAVLHFKPSLHDEQCVCSWVFHHLDLKETNTVCRRHRKPGSRSLISTHFGRDLLNII